uniref:Bestrophin homolog n=1 Tax=Panagrellus redivivus TaxID=6233 RepID=A0A7E4VFE0_PANRE
MTVSYTLDISRSNTKSVIKLLFRWRGSIWKAVWLQLLAWCIAYFSISIVYRFALSNDMQKSFDTLATYFETYLEKAIPLSFMLGFFVNFVINRWKEFFHGLGWIDDFALAIATYLRGSTEQTRVLRRTLIRYLVLTQTLVLRDISLQVRKRFPALETLIAAGLLTQDELERLEKIPDVYTRYWIPCHWISELLYEAREYGHISSDYLLEKISDESNKFRHGLAELLKFDWVPVPLVYPQVIFLTVRIFFALCLISRQFLRNDDHDIYVPVMTIFQFIVFMGWVKVAEALLNPLGEDDDDLECNYVIDKNLICGMAIVDQGGQPTPKLGKDIFWDDHHMAPLYSLESAKRSVHPLIGSACKVNLVSHVNEITMTPHKNKLAHMSDAERYERTRIVDVADHNVRHNVQKRKDRRSNPDKSLSDIRKRVRTDTLSRVDNNGNGNAFYPEVTIDSKNMVTTRH